MSFDMGFLKGKESKRCLGENQVKFAISREKTRSMSQKNFLMKNVQQQFKIDFTCFFWGWLV